MKTMVVDILKSDDGKKAVEEALTGENSSSKEGQSGQSSEEGGSGGGSGGSMGMKMLMPMQSAEQMKIAVKDTLVSPEYKKEIEKIMTDPRFAGEFAKAINSQSKQLHMQLIKDPSYQKSIEAMLKSPELTKMYMDLTKTPEYRKQSMTVMHDAMQNPIFRLEVMNLLKTVVQEELQPKVEKKVVSKAVQAAISKVVEAAKVGAKENKEEANNKKAGLINQPFFFIQIPCAKS